MASFCLAASFAVPEMPEAEWDDTEVVTNAALPLLAGMGHCARRLPGHGFSEPRDLGLRREHPACHKNTIASPQT